MVKPVIINSTNSVPSDYNNVFEYNFPRGSVVFKNDYLALGSLNIYYSWYNITSSTTYSRYGNNFFQYVWYYGGSSATFDVTIPDGTYEISDISAFFQSVMYANGHYLTDTNSGANVYYMEFIANATTGLVQFNSYAIPTSLPSGYSAPSGWPGFPTTASTPQVIITSAFDKIIGFSDGTYPSTVQTTNYSVESSSTPQISPLNSIVIACNLVNNEYSLPSTVFYSFPALTGVQFGSLITERPAEYGFVPIKDGTYNSISISFFAQDFSPVYIADTNLVLQLLIANKDDKQFSK